MYRYANSVLASTNEDAQGERFSRDQLQALVQAYPRMPINIGHDLGRQSVAYAENLRLEQVGDMWRVVAEICSEIPLANMGLSISATSMLHDASEAAIRCYLPYPAYNDRNLAGVLAEQGDISVGRLQKKGLTGTEIGLIVAVTALLIGPEWTIQYQERIRPQIIRALSLIRSHLKPRGVDADIRISLQRRGAGTIDLILIPDRYASTSGQEPNAIDEAIEQAIGFATHHERQDIKRLRSVFYPDRSRYEIINVEYADGTDLNIVP